MIQLALNIDNYIGLQRLVKTPLESVGMYGSHKLRHTLWYLNPLYWTKTIVSSLCFAGLGL
jgi:hypothetical protein